MEGEMDGRLSSDRPFVLLSLKRLREKIEAEMDECDPVGGLATVQAFLILDIGYCIRYWMLEV